MIKIFLYSSMFLAHLRAIEFTYCCVTNSLFLYDKETETLAVHFLDQDNKQSNQAFFAEKKDGSALKVLKRPEQVFSHLYVRYLDQQHKKLPPVNLSQT